MTPSLSPSTTGCAPLASVYVAVAPGRDAPVLESVTAIVIDPVVGRESWISMI